MGLAGIPFNRNLPASGIADRPLLVPRYLKQGDLVGITCPAGNISLQEIQPAMMKLEEWGFSIRIGQTVGKKDFIYGGTDAERLNDFQDMIDDPSIKAILFGRGGYGSMRIIDRIDFTNLLEHPKWLIGFSDISVIHAHLHTRFNMASIHSKMCNSFPNDWTSAEQGQVDSILSIEQALKGQNMAYSAGPQTMNRVGTAVGQLVGGNLKTIESISDSPSDLQTAGKILFLEDTGEYLYSIDRMFWNLKRAGKLNQLKGLIIGGFKAKPDDPGEEFGKNIYEIVMEKLEDCNFPVCFDFPVGHQKDNYALKCGLYHRLDVKADQVKLTELIAHE